MHTPLHWKSVAEEFSGWGVEEVCFALVEALHKAWRKGPEADRVTIVSKVGTGGHDLGQAGWSRHIFDQHHKEKKGQRRQVWE